MISCYLQARLRVRRRTKEVQELGRDGEYHGDGRLSLRRPGMELEHCRFGSLIMADTSKLASPAQPNRANRSGAEEFTIVTISPSFTPD